MSAPAHAAGPDCDECVRLRDQVRRLTLLAQDQAKTLAAITSDVPPDAPSVAIVYSFWADSKRDSYSWDHCWQRITPLVSNLGALPAQLLNAARWDQHRALRKTQPGRFGKPPCDHTLNIELQRAKEMIDFGVLRGMLKFNALSPAKAVKAVSQRETKLTADDIERLLEACDDVTDRRLCDGDDDGQRAATLRGFILCCFDSLLRFNETRHLRRDRIRSDGSVELLASETKSRRPRTIVLTPRTLEAIGKIERVPGNPYVFVRRDGKHPNEAGEIIGANTIRDWFRRVCVASGVDAKATPKDRRVRLHDCRSGGASHADENGARANAIRTALGHVRLDTTQRYLRADAVNNAHEIALIMSGQADTTTGGRRGPRRAPREKTKGPLKNNS